MSHGLPHAMSHGDPMRPLIMIPRDPLNSGTYSRVPACRPATWLVHTAHSFCSQEDNVLRRCVLYYVLHAYADTMNYVLHCEKTLPAVRTHGTRHTLHKRWLLRAEPLLQARRATQAATATGSAVGGAEAGGGASAPGRRQRVKGRVRHHCCRMASGWHTVAIK